MECSTYGDFELLNQLVESNEKELKDVIFLAREIRGEQKY